MASDLNEMLIFTRVVQSGSFTAAARLLDMPKSSVSRKISDLEDRLGARLLQRTTRKLGLTDVGRIYYDRCARIVGEIEEADQAVGNMQAAPCGPLRVTAPLSFSLLGPIVGEYLKRYPQVQVELVCTDRRVDLVNEGFDLALRAGALDDSSLVSRSLGAIERVLVASPAYLKQRGSPRLPADLPQHASIAFGAISTPGLWTLSSGDKQVEVRITARLTVNDLELVCEAARAGIGIALIPRFVCADDLRTGKLRQILRDWRSGTTPLWALYPTTRHLSQKVLAFVELLRERLPTTGLVAATESSS
jgi:DNA-binding transcriptional LysR family regulator